jgi:hypothetical protein
MQTYPTDITSNHLVPVSTPDLITPDKELSILLDIPLVDDSANQVAVPLVVNHPRSIPRRFSANDLKDMILPEIAFAVPQYIPEGIVILAGKPKLGKSWLALNIALRIGRGESVLNQQPKQGQVLYLALEDHPRRLLERLELLEPDGNWENLDFWTECPRQNEGGLEQIRDWLEKNTNAKLVVIDVWGRFKPQKSSGKSDYAHITESIQALQQLAFKHHVSLILVCHTRKGDKDMTDDPFDEVLGSTGITSNADATMILARARMQELAILKVTGRDIEEREVSLEFDKQTGQWLVTDAVIEPVLPSEQQKVLDAIRQGHTILTSLEKALDKKRSAVLGLLKSLQNSGHVMKEGPGTYRCTNANKIGPDVTDNADITAPAQTGPDITDNTDFEQADQSEAGMTSIQVLARVESDFADIDSLIGTVPLNNTETMPNTHSPNDQKVVDICDLI